MRPVLRSVPASGRRAFAEGADAAGAVGVRGEPSPAGSPNGWLLSRGFLLCAAGPDGGLRAMPVWGIWLDGTIVFSMNSEGVAPDDPRQFAATVVQLESADRVALVEGTAERLEDRATLSRFVAACAAKYGPETDAGDPGSPVYVLRRQADLALEAEGVAEAAADREFDRD
jgi:hypothetical protein